MGMQGMQITLALRQEIFRDMQFIPLKSKKKIVYVLNYLTTTP
jgi:hypothetical protein